MNQLQDIQLQILKAFLDVCCKLNLQYYLICGSALGAVKYKGFIPWDDDIDVALPRRDYNLFMEQGQGLLPKHYFLQNYKTDKGFPTFSAKIRDVRTTYIENDHCHLRHICHGVFIDVIPLDAYPEDDKAFLERFDRFNRCRRVHLKSPENYKNHVKKLLRPFFSINRYYGSFEAYLSEIAKEDHPYYCNLHNAKNGNLYLPSSYYGQGAHAIFEGIDVLVPAKYDEYLSAYYGDWRAELPEEQRVGHHYCQVCDLTRPYTDYTERLPGGKLRIRSPK